MKEKELAKPSPRELAKYQKLDIPIHPEIKRKIISENEDRENKFQMYVDEVNRLNEALEKYQSKVMCYITNEPKTALECLDMLLRNGCRGCPERDRKTKEALSWIPSDRV